MAKSLKRMLSSQLQDAVKGSDGAVFVNLGPMTVEQNMRLRGLLRTKAGGARLRVLHNRTARVAFKEAGWNDKVAGVLKGPTAAIFGGDGAAAIARTVVEWTRTDKLMVLKGALAEGEFFDAKGVRALATMPDKQTLRGMIAGAISGSARGIATVVAAPGASLARVLQARIDAKGFSADGGDAPAAAS
jgi:large subunit ribosomal protein L10